MSYFIYLNVNRMNANNVDILEWKMKHDTIIDTTTINPDYIVVDVEKLYKSTKFQNWLVLCGKYIDYPKSKYTIENLHVINNTDTKNLIDNKIKIINNPIKKSELESNYKFNLNDDKYALNASATEIANYQYFDFDNYGKLQNAKFGKHVKDRYCFSSPFLKSITDKDINPSIKDSTIFHIVEYSDSLGNKIGIRIDLESGGKYYNFSQTPPPSIIFDTTNPSTYGNSAGNVFFVGEEALDFFVSKMLALPKIKNKIKIQDKIENKNEKFIKRSQN